MDDLNDLFYFHGVITHGGFSEAARKMGVPKSTLSKRVARLESELNVRLIQRSTRNMRPTDVGREFFTHCEAMLANVHAARAVSANAQGEPCGIVRVSCPQGLIQDLVAEIVPAFMERYPKVRIQLKERNQPVDLVTDRVDLALRSRARFDTDQSLVIRRLGHATLVLVAAPLLVKHSPMLHQVHQLRDCPSLSLCDHVDVHTWSLVGPGGETREIVHQPRLACSDAYLIRTAALRGLGVAALPEHVCRAALADGRLVRVLPEWHIAELIHAAFTSRKAMMPSTRAFLECLAEMLPRMLSDAPADHVLP